MLAHMTIRTGTYIVPTHRWYIERTVWLIAGLVTAAFLLAAWWFETRATIIIAELKTIRENLRKRNHIG